MSQFAPQFDANFQLPAVDSGFQTLFLIAQALVPRMAELEKELISSERFLPRLAAYALRSLGKSLPKNDLARIWTQFFIDAEIENLPAKALRILGEVRDEALLQSVRAPVGAAELTKSHQIAHTWVNGLLHRNGVKLLVAPATLIAQYDQEGRIFCASTSQILTQLHWVYQPIEHALYGTLIPEIILAHEYISHLAPRNAHLGRIVTEVWLVVALMRSFRENASEYGVERWKVTIWYLMQEAIKKHLQALQSVWPSSQAANDVGPQGIDEFALILYGRAKSAFWEFTMALLTAPDDLEASQIDKLFRKMVSDEEKWIDIIIKSKTITINYLLNK